MTELTKGLKKLNCKSSIDQDGISNKILKNISEITKETILKLFNKCLELNRVPAYWKVSTMNMILKKGADSWRTKSYRPISITPCMARLFERLILARLKSHLNDNNIIIAAQSGFRNYRQTKDNIIFLSQKVQESFIEKRKTLAIFFDIESAFDKVWHNGLIYKLAKQKIISLLSKTLYNLYTNDLPIRNSRRSNNNQQEFSLLFADDIAYLLTFKCQTEAKLTAQKYLNELESWTKLWRLQLAPHKSAQIIFSRARKFDIKEIDLIINGTKIPKDDEPKFLGIKFDRRLNFGAQINNIKSKILDRTNIMKIVSLDPLWKITDPFSPRIL